MSITKKTDPLLQKLQLENKRLLQAVEELSVLNDLAREIGASNSSDKIIQTIISRALRAVHAEQGMINLVEQQSSNPAHTLVRSIVDKKEHQPIHLNNNLMGWMQINKQPLCLNDPPKDKRFLRVKWEEPVHSVLCVPLLVKSQLIGILTVYNKKEKEGFTDNDQRLLTIIAAQSAQIIENARLYEKEHALFHVKEEIRLASEIQHGLLPKSQPFISGYDIIGLSISAEKVGGDYFDFIPIGENKLAICLGDVTGKGLSAALLMANLQATIRGQTLFHPSPGDCLQKSNELMYKCTPSQMFATLYYGILDIHQHSIQYANAGHNWPIHFNPPNEPIMLNSNGLALGLVPNVAYNEYVLTLQPGDVVIIYSDGITEAMNSEDEEFGEEKMKHFIQQHQNISAKDLAQKLINEVTEHTNHCPPMDDRTLVVIKRK